MKKKTLIYLGKESFPEIMVKMKHETDFDYIRRSLVTVMLAWWQLFEGNVYPEEIEVSGYLARPIIIAIEKWMDWFIEKGKTGELKVLLEKQKDSSGAEELIYRILSGKSLG